MERVQAGRRGGAPSEWLIPKAGGAPSEWLIPKADGAPPGIEFTFS